MICVFVVWLHIKAHVSRSVSNKILLGIQFILATTLNLIQVILALSGVFIQLSEIKIPKDIRTAYALYSVEPEIIRTACCPKCYSLFSQPIPWKCNWKSSPRSRPCNTELWTTRNTQKGPKSIPRTLYATQSFDSWLKFFLSRQVIEDNLEKTFRQNLDYPVAFGDTMKDIQDSPAWKNLHGIFRSPRNLVFGIYIDWFNPLSNKIAGMCFFCYIVKFYCLNVILPLGKQVSCGAIVLYCLNLPPHLRYKSENTFIVGLTPSPKMPTSTTICHLLDPFIESVAKYGFGPGLEVPTFNNPTGALVQVKVTPFIADLEASRKVSGFMDHAAIMFCAYCLCTHDQIERLDLYSWQLRDSAEVLQQAHAWFNASTKTAKETMQKESGVRWSPFFNLPYWDPVKFAILGFMHNWLEGILQHHLRTLWGIGRDKKELEQAQDVEKDELFTDIDILESGSELDDIYYEAWEHRHTDTMDIDQDMPLPPPSSASPTASSIDLSDHSSADTETPYKRNRNPYAYDYHEVQEDSDDENDSDYISMANKSFSFTSSQLDSIQSCIYGISLPTWVQRPPINLGEPGHGKLKAREYLTLFTTIFPLIVPEFWYTVDAESINQQHFHCFYHLVAATNIISSFQTSNSQADEYTQHYIQYRSAIQKLFPDHGSKPNHHYAMHNANLLKYWGPLASFSEFPGERMNGMLQKINTNHQIRK